MSKKQNQIEVINRLIEKNREMSFELIKKIVEHDNRIKQKIINALLDALVKSKYSMNKCKDCNEEAVMTWIGIGVFCDACFHKEYLKRYPEALDEHLQLVSKRRKM